MKNTKILFLCALLAACSDDTEATDGGQDATTNDAMANDAAKDATPTDASADVASEASSDASDASADVASDVIVDAPIEAAIGCDGGCTKFSFECSNAQPACQCVGLAQGQTGPVCDASAANCLVDPCLTKTVQCVNDTCVIQ